SLIPLYAHLAMSFYIDEIVKAKAEELERRRQNMPLSELEKLGSKSSKKDFAAALKGDDIRLIAEVKKASPSRGVIARDLDPVKLARTYAQNGAAAISVLTEERYFGGSLEHLSAISAELEKTPLLRKDFIFDPYQIYESRAQVNLDSQCIEHVGAAAAAAHPPVAVLGHLGTGPGNHEGSSGGDIEGLRGIAASAAGIDHWPGYGYGGRLLSHRPCHPGDFLHCLPLEPQGGNEGA
ncbi:unnamed protein product, partial [marine sediment metagenome]